MKFIFGFSVTAALVTGVLVVSCAPIPQSYSRNGNKSLSGNLAAQMNGKNASATPSADKIISGDWVCSAKAGCAFSKISIFAKDGNATLEGDRDEKPQDAKIHVTSYSDHIHLDLNLEGSTDALSGDISLKDSSNDLVVNDEHYARQLGLKN